MPISPDYLLPDDYTTHSDYMPLWLFSPPRAIGAIYEALFPSSPKNSTYIRISASRYLEYFGMIISQIDLMLDVDSDEKVYTYWY